MASPLGLSELRRHACTVRALHSSCLPRLQRDSSRTPSRTRDCRLRGVCAKRFSYVEVAAGFFFLSSSFFFYYRAVADSKTCQLSMRKKASIHSAPSEGPSKFASGTVSTNKRSVEESSRLPLPPSMSLFLFLRRERSVQSAVGSERFALDAVSAFVTCKFLNEENRLASTYAPPEGQRGSPSLLLGSSSITPYGPRRKPKTFA